MGSVEGVRLQEFIVVRCLCVTLAVAAVAGHQPVALPHGGAAELPPRLETYLAAVVKPTPAERKRLQDGMPIARLLEAEEGREVAVFGAIWVDAPMRRYIEALQDIEQFERGGGFVVTKRISVPPRLDDFAAMRLPQEDVADLRECRVGDCKVKLGERALQRFRTQVNWKSGDVLGAANAVMQREAFEYVSEYLEGGNERLPAYRDKEKPASMADEFRAMVDRMPGLTSGLPDLRRYLLGYPEVTVPGSTSLLYWQETRFGLKPTLRINHLTVCELAGDTVVASKMLYASHYFWTSLELRVLLPDESRGGGFWLASVNRSRADGLGGLTGRLIRGRVRREVQKGTLASLTATKKRLEQ